MTRKRRKKAAKRSMIEDFKNPRNDSEKLPNGLVRYYTQFTEGGGSWMKYPLIDLIKKYGQKQIYDHCYEWCSGSAPIGFSILDCNLSKKLTCNDMFDVAIDDCIDTAQKNNIEHKVNAYVTSAVKDIPVGELWDLVVSNPPHAYNRTKEIDNNEYLCRILLDEDKQTHKEFYLNIRSRLTEDAELFIIEHDAGNFSIPDFKIMAAQGGLDLIDIYKFTLADAIKLGVKENAGYLKSSMMDTFWWVMHFKVKENK